MEHISEYDKPPRITLKRSLIIFVGNIIGLYLISFFGWGVDVSRFGEVALFVIFISFINGDTSFKRNSASNFCTPIRHIDYRLGSDISTIGHGIIDNNPFNTRNN